MKKLLTTTAVLAALAFPAQAEEGAVAFNPYVGFDLMRTNLDYNTEDFGGGSFVDYGTIAEDSLNGVNIHVGSRFNRHFGAEIGYFRTQEKSKSTANGATVGPGPTVATADFTTDVQLQGLTLDALGYVPLGEDYPVELIGTAGLSWQKAEASVTVPGVGVADVDESELGFRAGAGAQFKLNEHVNARALARWQTADFDGLVDHAWTYAVGLNYSF